MKTLHYRIRFITPAFLGNAEQSGQWRTPPFKALLRQWWRVAYAADKGFALRIDEMRREEGHLFGHAWLKDDQDDQGNKVAARKSAVRVRLSRWDEGKMKSWEKISSISHPEVRVPIESGLYLGYGPISLPRGEKAPKFKANAAIQADENAVLSIAMPEHHAPQIEQALWLMDRYGTLGGRSRNGWGSLALLPDNGWSETIVPVRPWRDCLEFDWPHALGTDSTGALIWQTQPNGDWKALMQSLAKIKIGLRTQFAFHSGMNADRPEERHWLSYPVTNHSVKAWGNNARLPNMLRFKVRRTENNQLAGVIFHIPHLPPANFNPRRQTVEQVWQQVHAFLDQQQQLKRIPE